MSLQDFINGQNGGPVSTSTSFLTGQGLRINKEMSDLRDRFAPKPSAPEPTAPPPFLTGPSSHDVSAPPLWDDAFSGWDLAPGSSLLKLVVLLVATPHIILPVLKWLGAGAPIAGFAARNAAGAFAASSGDWMLVSVVVCVCLVLAAWQSRLPLLGGIGLLVAHWIFIGG